MNLLALIALLAAANPLRLREDSLELQCSACPTAWNVKTADGRSAYIRYRYGGLSISIFRSGGYERVWEKQVGGDLDGVMSEQEMRAHLAGVVEFIP